MAYIYVRAQHVIVWLGNIQLEKEPHSDFPQWAILSDNHIGSGYGTSRRLVSLRGSLSSGTTSLRLYLAATKLQEHFNRVHILWRHFLPDLEIVS